MCPQKNSSILLASYFKCIYFEISFDENFAFYNLAYNADTPKLRYQSIHQTLDLKPEIIFYGITYYDLNGYVWENIKKNCL